jgi:hypothetical protein
VTAVPPPPPSPRLPPPTCSETCARADWPAHKLVCKRLRETRDKAEAAWEASGSQHKGGSYKQGMRDATSWYFAVPGLGNEVSLLAWKHRSESPVVLVTTSPIFDAEGRGAQVSVMPRSSWNEDPRFSENMRENIRMVFGGANFSQTSSLLTLRHRYRSPEPRMLVLCFMPRASSEPLKLWMR